MLRFQSGTVITPYGEQADWVVLTDSEKMIYAGPTASAPSIDGKIVDLQDSYLVPGFIDLHVHGGSNFDFMDNTPGAWETILHAHARHGTTSLTPTTTVARHDQHLRFLELTRIFSQRKPEAHPPGARVVGAHLYGPYFAKEAKGCHPGDPVRTPTPEDYLPYFEFADVIRTATVAPELSGAEEFVKACRARGIRCNAGHSFATFAQMAEAVGWGVRHVDHLFCAMSDRARLRQSQPFPMRAGVMEATLFFDELTTEVIADGKHMLGDLLRLAYKIKGPDRLALVTDSSRAMDMPDGSYIFGAQDGGEPFIRRDGVGLMPDGKALASSVVGMDHCLQTFHRLVPEAGLINAVKMASLTPARILGLDSQIGSIETGKRADLVVLDRDLTVQKVFIGGREIGEP